MRTRIIKEFQILRLPFIATLLLTIIPLAIWRQTYKEYSFVLFAFGCVAMACLSFGTEFQHRTLSLLLSQPISRSSIWREKMSILATFLGLSLGVLVICLVWFFSVKELLMYDFELLLLLVFVPFCTLCTAPYISLLTRNTTLAMVLTALIPLCIGVFGLELGHRLFTRHFTEVTYAMITSAPLLLVYCLLFLRLGYNKWKTLEDWDNYSQEITLPGFEKLLPFKQTLLLWTGPFASLFKKEMHLQKLCFSLTAGSIPLAIFGICLLPFKSEPAELLIGVALVMTLFLMPMISGTVPFTEERNWGIAEWHLTLPPPASKQWTAKFLASFVTTLSISSAALLALYLAVVMLFVPHGATNISEAARRMDHHIILVYLLVLTVPTYMASFSTNTARSLILSILGITALFVPLFALRSTDIFQIFATDYLHADSFVVPALEAIAFICLVLAFTYTNFKRPGRPLRFLVYQSLAIYAFFSLIFVTCTSIDTVANAPVSNPRLEDRTHKSRPYYYRYPAIPPSRVPPR